MRWKARTAELTAQLKPIAPEPRRHCPAGFFLVDRPALFTRETADRAIIPGTKGRVDMTSKLITALLVGSCTLLAACNTVRGAAADVGSAANCTENAIHGGRC